MKHNKNLIRINRGEKMRLKNTLILITSLLIAISMISAVSAANEKVHVGPGDKFNHILMIAYSTKQDILSI